MKHLHELALGFGPDSRCAASLLMRYRFAAKQPEETLAQDKAPDDYKRHAHPVDVRPAQNNASTSSTPTQPAALVLDLLKRYVSQASLLNKS